MRRYVVTLACCIMVLAATVAQGADLSLAVYNDGRVLVREVRSMTVPASGEMAFSGVPETIRPDTLSVRSLSAPAAFQLLETGYRYAPITASSVLEASVGKRLTVILPDPADADARVSREATLLSAGAMPVFNIDGKLYVGSYDGIVLPSLPEVLDREPVLRWLVQNTGSKQHDLEVSYLASGMAWRADYALVLADDEKSASLTAWATVENHSGSAFDDAHVKLVAGEVGQAAGGGRMLKGAPAPMMAMEMDAAGPEVRGVGEYHVYDLPRSLTLTNGSTRQVRLFSASAVPVVTKLVSQFGVSRSRYGADKMSQPVNSIVTLANTEKRHLGVPMPAGVARIYKADKDGASLLMGEDNVRHTAPGSDVKLRLGSPFDISVERVQTAYQQTGKRSAVMTWDITVKNGSDRQRTIKLREQFHGQQWKITKSTMKYDKVSSGMVEFDLLLPAGTGATTLSYTVDITS